MNRPTRDALMMDMASMVATRGTCDRKQVGAVIAREGRIIAMGYNGAAPGLPHCDENYHGWQGAWQDMFGEVEAEPGEEDRWLEYMAREKGCRNATHAEANALAFAARYGISTDQSTLFVTVSPCDTCARLLLAAGISDVFYQEEYRDTRGLELIRSAGGTVAILGSNGCRDSSPE